ncbi:MAG: nicotinate-nucleotide--dimethylbenzimidazole phosphoribosyltransferase [Deltaproteobacteria bacterium]|nr:MAG: nicotinate-nucleotide--dimethylbenzimidazole phosphoribosyltransferase [Deltaproteobacteria bacterium]
MNHGEVSEIIASIKPVEKASYIAPKTRMDDLTKPPGSLGKLEDIAIKIAAIQGTDKPEIGKKRIYTLAGDHGVTEEGVSAFPSEVTPQMVMNFLAGGAAINVLTRHVGSEIQVADLGVAYDFEEVPGLLPLKVGMGTANFTKGPAMKREACLEAVIKGVNLAKQAAKDGVTLLGVGEMGIGNTTSAAALLTLYGGMDPDEAVGRGTGVDDAGLKRKANAIRRGIEINTPDLRDPIDVLSKLGGYEIAGMTGVYLGAAACGVPIVADGFISTSSALVALKLAPALADYLFLSHLSLEQGHRKMIELTGLSPLLELDMRLGEGTGAALAFSIIEGATKILSEMATFAEAGVTNKD